MNTGNGFNSWSFTPSGSGGGNVNRDDSNAIPEASGALIRGDIPQNLSFEQYVKYRSAFSEARAILDHGEARLNQALEKSLYEKVQAGLQAK